MTTCRRVAAGLVALGLVVLAAPQAQATSYSSAEVTGNTIAGRLAAEALRDPWSTAVSASGHTTATPIVMGVTPGLPLSGVIGASAGGTTISVERSRYSAHPTTPVLVGSSTNPGLASCTTSGTSLQDNSPRPTLLLGNAGCTNGKGVAYAESGGAGESTTRDAVTFTFSRPLWGFGAWFGDLETRTDGAGVPAIVRLLDGSGAVLEEFQVVPAGDQSLCSSASAGCGNRATRWIGFTNVLASAMVVIVGDEDAGGSALDEGFSFIGPSPVDALPPAVSLTIDTAPIGPVSAGTVVSVPVMVTNVGEVPVSGLAGATCSPTAVAPGASVTCAVAHTVTQAELDAEVFDLSAAVTGTWIDLTATATDTAQVPLTASAGFGVSLTSDIASFDAVGTVISYTVTATNIGNQTRAPDEVTLPGVSLACTPAGAVPPGASVVCTGSYTTAAGADVVRTATVAWDALSAQSAPVTVIWVARRAFTVALSADAVAFDSVGDPITYTLTVTNTGNGPDAPDSVSLPGVTLTCAPTGPVAPGAALVCTGSLTTTSGADVVRAATVGWDALTVGSDPVTVVWTPMVEPVPELPATGGPDAAPGLAGLVFLILGGLLVSLGVRRTY